MTSQFEGYLAPIHDQEIPTKYVINKWQKEAGKETTCNTKCRLCKHGTEDVNHIISPCPEVSVRYYLPVRHDIVAKAVLNALALKIDPTDKFSFSISKILNTSTKSKTVKFGGIFLLKLQQS